MEEAIQFGVFVGSSQGWSCYLAALNWRNDMGFFSAWKAMNAYESALKSYGVAPTSLPADLNSRVCSYANQQYERTCNTMKGFSRMVSLEFAMESAGALVALCVLGPTNFSRYEKMYGVSFEDTAVDAANAWKNRGPDSSIEAKIIETVSDAGVLNIEFANAFNAIL